MSDPKDKAHRNDADVDVKSTPATSKDVGHDGESSAVMAKAATATTEHENTDKLPQPHPSDVGSVDYYANRQADFKRRYPSAPPAPPDYYMSYGDKYAHRFTTVLKPKLSEKGKVWIEKTFRLLQQAIEKRLNANPGKFDELERNSDAFKSFAYETHPRAYLDGGLHTLPPTDLMRIATTPDLGDLATTDGVAQIFATAKELLPQWGHDAVDAAGDAAHSVAHSAKGLATKAGHSIKDAWNSVF